MTSFIVGLIIGLVVGCMLGVVVMALCAVSGRASVEEENMLLREKLRSTPTGDRC